jgi:L-lactate dehydrogenase
MKIGVIGAGAVGSACLMSLVMRGAALSPAVQIRDGDYSDLTGAALVMITAGMNEKAGGVDGHSG